MKNSSKIHKHILKTKWYYKKIKINYEEKNYKRMDRNYTLQYA